MVCQSYGCFSYIRYAGGAFAHGRFHILQSHFNFVHIQLQLFVFRSKALHHFIHVSDIALIAFTGFQEFFITADCRLIHKGDHFLRFCGQLIYRPDHFSSHFLDLCCRRGGIGSQFPDFIRNHGKSPSGCSCPRSFDTCI